jgi:ABC-type multidrug transport system fused ATPase/permease subunit
VREKISEDIIIKTEKEVSRWTIAARTLPFVALAGLFFIYFIGWDNMYEQALTIGAIIFFSVAVFWWWWAIYKIASFAKLLEQTTKNFEYIKNELSKFKKDLGK